MSGAASAAGAAAAQSRLIAMTMVMLRTHLIVFSHVFQGGE